MSFKFKVGDKVKIGPVFEDSGIPEGTVLEIYEIDRSEYEDLYPYRCRVASDHERANLWLREREIFPLDEGKFKSTGMTVPFNARYLSTGKVVTVISVTDTSLGRIYWITSPEGFVFSMPEAMFIKVL
jgi:hypothetical protein